MTRGGRIVGGSKDIVYAYGSRLAPAGQEACFELVARAFSERFPMFGPSMIEIFWGVGSR